MPQVNPSTSAPKIISNPLRISWRNVILGLFIGTTLISGGLVAFYYFELKNSTSSLQNQQMFIAKPRETSPSATPVQPRIITDETADWKIHQNKEAGYKISYPDSWTAKTYSNYVDSGPLDIISGPEGEIWVDWTELGGGCPQDQLSQFKIKNATLSVCITEPDSDGGKTYSTLDTISEEKRITWSASFLIKVPVAENEKTVLSVA